METTARLQKIIFENHETGFVIGAFLVDDAIPYTLTAKGNIVNPQTGMCYKMTLKKEPSNRYGEQYQITAYETLIPMDPHGIFKYITRICRFVGAAIGGRIVDQYGPDTLIIMKNDPERLYREIQGITLERAMEIQATLCENEENERQMVELESLLDVPGMRKDLPGKMIHEFKSNAVSTLKKNPYVITEFTGIGFALADQVAVINCGYDPAGINRKKQVAVHCLKEEMQITGSTWVPERTLIQKMKELVPVPGLDDGLSELKKDGILVNIISYVNQIRGRVWAFHWVDRHETQIAQKITGFLCRSH